MRDAVDSGAVAYAELRIGQLSARAFLNGTPINAHPYALEELLYKTPPQWIQAIEVYDSRARMPVEFQPNCGVVAIWTRTR